MSPARDEFLPSLDRWFQLHREKLEESSLRVRLQRSPADGRDKQSAWLTLESPESAGGFTVWSSGEAELAFAGNGVELDEHHELAAASQVADAAERLEALVSGALEPHTLPRPSTWTSRRLVDQETGERYESADREN